MWRTGPTPPCKGNKAMRSFLEESIPLKESMHGSNPVYESKKITHGDHLKGLEAPKKCCPGLLPCT